MRLTLKITSLFLLFSCYTTLSFGGAYSVFEKRSVNCGVKHRYQGVAGELVVNNFPSNSNIQPWSTWKSSAFGTQSFYGTGIIVTNVDVENANVTPVVHSANHFKGEGIGNIVVGFLQQWSNTSGKDAASIVFDEKNNPTLGFRLLAGNYMPGVHSGHVAYKVFSGVVGSNQNNGYSDYSNAFNWAVSTRGELCIDPLEIVISNSCTLNVNDINHGSVNAVEIEKKSAVKQSTVSLSCLLNDSVKLTLAGGEVRDQNVIVDMGRNVVSLLSISKHGDDVVKNGTKMQVASKTNYLYNIKSTLTPKDESKPLMGGGIRGDAIIRVEFN